MKFRTKIMGFPCYVDVIHYSPGQPAQVNGRMEEAVETIPAEFEYHILDLDEKLWNVLEESVTEEDETRLMYEYEAHITAEKYDIIF